MKENEIRPQDVFDEYLRLCEQDAEIYFDPASRIDVACQACGADGKHAFTKTNFTYQECQQCFTLYVSPRPPAEAFRQYYQNSESAKFLATTFYKITSVARRQKLWRPKARMVHELLKKYGTGQLPLIDIGGGYGIFAEEYKKCSGSEVLVIEPGPALARICRDKGLVVIEAFLERIESEQLPAGSKAFVSFEMFEHLHNPEKFLRHLGSLMGSGDIFIFTTLSATGVDIQALWNDSKSVSPPHHLNFLNPKSVGILLERTGFELLQTSTPGKLDIDILFNNQEYIKDRFWRTFISQATEDERRAMQRNIAKNRLSSHMLVVCRKP